MNKAIAIVSLCGAIFCSYKSGSVAMRSDIYQIEYDGIAGNEMIGNYTLSDLTGKTPARVELVREKLPHTLSFTMPHGSMVNAVANSTPENPVTVRILKNGVECGHPEFVGTGFPANMICTP